MVKKRVGRPSLNTIRQLGAIARYGMAQAILCLVKLVKVIGQRWMNAVKRRVALRNSHKIALYVIRSAISRQPARGHAIWKKPGFYGTVLVLIILAAGAFFLSQKRTPDHYSPLGLAGQQVAAAGADSKTLSGGLVNLHMGASKKEPEIGQAGGDILPAQDKST